MDEENTETIAKRVDETNNTAKTTPPTKPTNDAESGENGAMPAGPGEMGEMPEMNCEESEGSEANCEPPTPPESMEGFEGGPMGGGGFPGDTTQQTTTPSDNVLHPVAYLSLGAGSVILSTIIMYACFSNLTVSDLRQVAKIYVVYYCGFNHVCRVDYLMLFCADLDKLI